MSSLNLKEVMMISFLLDVDNGSTLVNQKGKEVIKVVVNKDSKTFHFELLDNVTKNDLLFDINDEFVGNFDDKVQSLLNGYSKVQFEVKELNLKINETYPLIIFIRYISNYFFYSVF
jgi:hypothetical protein